MAKIAQLVIPVSSPSHGDLHPPIGGPHRQLYDLSSWATILISILPLFEGLRFTEFQTFLSYFLASKGLGQVLSFLPLHPQVICRFLKQKPNQVICVKVSPSCFSINPSVKIYCQRFHPCYPIPNLSTRYQSQRNRNFV